MKTKTINIVLCRKFDSWLASIENEHVRDLAQKNSIITGGCIVSMLLAEQVNDYDLYFRDRETAQAVAEYYVEKFKRNPPSRFADGKHVDICVEAADGRVAIVVKSAGIASETGANNYRYFEMEPDAQSANPEEYVEAAMNVADDRLTEDSPAYRPVFLSSNAITLSDKVQIIVRFFGDPENIHENYDFVHCTNYWDSKTRQVHLNQRALEAILTKELRYVGSKYPLCSVIRTRKFIQRGWTINAGQYLKMLMQLNDLDLNDITVLRDQLVGVDAAYFIEVIEKLKEKNPEKVNRAYLTEIIDRMF